MPKFYCEYCGIYLTHSSPTGRGQHSKGRKHINNRIEYYRNSIQEMQMEQAERNKDGFFITNQMMPNLMQGGSLAPIQMNMPGFAPQGIMPNQTSLQQGGIRNIQINSSLPVNQQMQGIQPQSIQAQSINVMNPQIPQMSQNNPQGQQMTRNFYQ